MSTSQDGRGTSGVVGLLAGLRGEARALTETLWAAHGPAELMDAVAEVEALKATLDAVELQVVRELEATGVVKGTGWASTQDYLTHTAGGHKGAGPATVRLASAVTEPVLAPVADALADGWLSTVKAQVIERAVDRLPGNPEVRARGVQVLLTEAKRLDATDLRKTARHLAAVVDPDGEDRREERALDRQERAAHLGRFLSLSDDQAGGAWIKGRCSSEDAAVIKATLIPLAAPQPAEGPLCDPGTCEVPGCGHDGRDPRDHGARMLDALVEGCRLLQTSEVLPDCHGAVPRIVLTMRFDDLRRQAGFAETETGEQLCAATVRRLACEAGVIPAVLGGDSEVLDVGRLRRLVTPAIWKALVTRDRHCRFPHCTRPPVMTHAHHIQHWAEGGPTSLPNLVLLCGHHHRLVHAGPWKIRRRGPTGFDFHPPPAANRPRRHQTHRAPPDGRPSRGPAHPPADPRGG